MSNIGNKKTFAKNLKYYMEKENKTQKEVADFLEVPTSTFNAWMKEISYPRIDKIEKLSDYFRILKSDLIEEQTDEMRKQKVINKEIADLSKRMMDDSSFFETVKIINEMDAQRMDSLLNLIKK